MADQPRIGRLRRLGLMVEPERPLQNFLRVMLIILLPTGLVVLGVAVIALVTTW